MKFFRVLLPEELVEIKLNSRKILVGGNLYIKGIDKRPIIVNLINKTYKRAKISSSEFGKPNTDIKKIVLRNKF